MLNGEWEEAILSGQFYTPSSNRNTESTNLSEEKIMKYGARAQLIGKVTGMKLGPVICQVNFEIPEKSLMSSVLTRDSFEELDLKKGDKVKVVIKAVNVLLVKE
jgi:molybdopterin-binding protein